MKITEWKDTSRRSFLSLGASGLASLCAAPLAARSKRVPIGLELYSVREELKADVKNVLRQVAKIGYEVVEFYAVYFDYPTELAKELRRLMDDLGIRCVSTHNAGRFLTPENLPRTIELNQILGSTQIIQASAGRITTAQGWRKVAENLNRVAEKLKPLGLRTGFHNHHVEFQPLEGRLPIDILGESTGPDVILQLDVGAALSAGGDPVAFMKKYRGRVASMHVKDWSPDPAKGFKVLLGEGAANWKEIFEVAETAGGIEYYIIEQEGAAYSPMETVARCYQIMKKLRG